MLNHSGIKKGFSNLDMVYQKLKANISGDNVFENLTSTVSPVINTALNETDKKDTYCSRHAVS